MLLVLGIIQLSVDGKRGSYVGWRLDMKFRLSVITVLTGLVLIIVGIYSRSQSSSHDAKCDLLLDFGLPQRVVASQSYDLWMTLRNRHRSAIEIRGVDTC